LLEETLCVQNKLSAIRL